MSKSEHDHTQKMDFPGDAQRETRATHETDSSSEADSAAAHIAELVRRTTERNAAPGPSSIPAPAAKAVPPVVQPRPVFERQATAEPTTVQPLFQQQQAFPPVVQPRPVFERQATAEPTTVQPVFQQQQAFPPTTVTPVFQQQPAFPPTTVTPISPSAASYTAPPIPPRTSKRDLFTVWPPSPRVLVAAGGALVVLILGGMALSSALESDPLLPAAKTAVVAKPASYVARVTNVVTDCAAHSHGKTRAAFKAENCVKATRILASGRVGGRKVLFVVSKIEMGSAEAAAGIKEVLDGDGTGNLDDLISDGDTFAGAPRKMPSSGYASVLDGNWVTVSEAGFIDGGRSSYRDPALRSAASKVATMISAQA